MRRDQAVAVRRGQAVAAVPREQAALRREQAALRREQAALRREQAFAAVPQEQEWARGDSR